MIIKNIRWGCDSGICCGPAPSAVHVETMALDDSGSSVFCLVSVLDCSEQVRLSHYSVYDILMNMGSSAASFESELAKADAVCFETHDYETESVSEEIKSSPYSCLINCARRVMAAYLEDCFDSDAEEAAQELLDLGLKNRLEDTAEEYVKYVTGLPELDDDEVEAKLRQMLTGNPADFTQIREFITDYEDDFYDIAETAFRIAVELDAFNYVAEYADEIDLNDDGYACSYLSSCSDDMAEILINHGAFRDPDYYAENCRFACSTEDGITVFAESFQQEVFEEYLKQHKLTEEDIAQELTEYGDGYPEDVYELLDLSVEDGKLVRGDMSGAFGSEMVEFLESLGYYCGFEGESFTGGSYGTYFIK